MPPEIAVFFEPVSEEDIKALQGLPEHLKMELSLKFRERYHL